MTTIDHTNRGKILGEVGDRPPMMIEASVIGSCGCEFFIGTLMGIGAGGTYGEGSVVCYPCCDEHETGGPQKRLLDSLDEPKARPLVDVIVELMDAE